MTTHDAIRPVAVLERVALVAVVVGGCALLVGALLLPSAIAVDRAVAGVGETVLDVPPLPEAFERPPETSVVRAADGTELAELHDEQDRVVVALSAIPLVTQNAVIATEDASFYAHKGVNHKAIIRAALANIESGEVEQGASTITQQYVRNIPNIGIDPNEQTVTRKIQEAIWAVELEKRMSKEEILERYLNTVYFGDGVYGIGTAAQHYFSKHVSQLSLTESATLAGLIRSPERNNPRKNPEAGLARRNIVIGQMLVLGFISGSEAETARESPLGLQVTESTAPTQPFFVEWIKDIVLDEDNPLQPDVQAALGTNKEERQRAVFEGGLVIHTTLDRQRQDLAESTIVTYLDDPLTDPLGAVVTIEPRSGAVAVMAVGPKQFGECPEGQRLCEVTKVIPAVPHSGASGREPGSSFKPVVITAALNEGFTPGYETETSSGQEIQGCTKTEGRSGYLVNNYAGGGGGFMNMYEAVKRSNNVYHVKLAKDTGVLNVLDMAETLGLKTITNRSDFGPESCSIGLGTPSVYPIEMASAFATLANRGSYCAPFAITRIEDRNGNVLYQHRDDCRPVVEEGVVDRVTDIMQGPPSEGGTAGYIRGQLGRPVAGKTGTTNDWTNAWFVGFVPQYATAVWVGYEYQRCGDGIETQCGSMFGVESNGSTYDRVTGGSIPGRLWADYMAAALEGVPIEGFTAPPPIPTATVPSVVGMNEAEATATIEAKRFKVRINVVVDHRPAGEVVNQNPPGESPSWVGSIVTLDVSDGTGVPPLPIVPDVLGQLRDDAIFNLQQAGFNVRILQKDTSDPSLEGRVVEQSPDPGTELEPGSQVVIAIGRREGGGGGGSTDGGTTDGGSTDGGTTDGGSTDGGGGGSGTGGGPKPKPSPSPTDGGGDG